MARPRQIDKGLVAKARHAVTHATDLDQLRAAQAVLLPAVASATLEQTAAILGVGRATVPRLQQRFRQWVRPPGDAAPLGRAAQGAAQCGRRSGVLGALGRAGQGGRPVGVVADPRRTGATVGTARGRLGGLAPAGSARMAQGGPGHAPPQERSGGAGGVEKKLPEILAAVVTPAELRGRSVRLMFQDEARFGRMARPRRCWAPLPWRPVMLNGYERQFVYVYGAVSPLQGDLDWMIRTEMNTVRMGEFLSQVSHAHPEDFIVMILDGASSHKAKDLPVPENIRLVPLPAYAPELNPQEHVWDELREKEFPNRVFNHLDAVVAQLHAGLPRLAHDHDRVRSITAWPWIVSLNLTAH
jgi:DDE superfamily endonuclease